MTAHSIRDIAGQLNLEPQELLRIWMAVGFAAPEDIDAEVIEPADVQAIEQVTALVRSQAVESDSLVPVLRSIGHSMSRLAEWESQMVHDDPGLIDRLEVVHNAIWRRHLRGTHATAEHDPTGSEGTVVAAVGFADMVGYTRLSRGIAVSELSALLDYFESATSEVIQRHGGAVVKTVGDEVMFATVVPADACAIGVELHHLGPPPEALGTIDWDIPQLRVGIGYGDVVTRYGDIYGEPVNRAARLTSAARPGTTLISSELDEAVSGDPRFRVRRLRAFRARGYSAIKPSVLKAR